MNEREAAVSAHFRNLLIWLAREVVTLTAEIADMRQAIPAEPIKGKQAGMRTQINLKRRQRARLLSLLKRNNSVSMWFFRTTEPDAISSYVIDTRY